MNMPIHASNAVNLALLILRVTLGLTIAAHGYNKFFGGGKIAGTAGWFDSIGVRPGKLNALMAATTEIGTGLLLVAGFLTPLAAAGLCSLMVVAIVTVHRKNGFFIFNPGAGIEYCLILAVTAIALGGLGAGNWSLDHATKIWNVSAATGLGIAAIVGVGGALLQLLAFYRPGKAAQG
jgi:putative oxidoreductase